jgi:hypothetical protein
MYLPISPRRFRDEHRGRDGDEAPGSPADRATCGCDIVCAWLLAALVLLGLALLGF